MVVLKYTFQQTKMKLPINELESLGGKLNTDEEEKVRKDNIFQ